MHIFPNKKQLKEWKVLSWATYIGAWLGLLAIVLTIFVFIYQERNKRDSLAQATEINNKSNEKTMNNLYISPIYKGSLTNMDLLSTEGTQYIVLSVKPVKDPVVLFEVNGEGFHFSLVLKGTEFVLTRNENIVKADIKVIKENSDFILTILWSFKELSIEINDKGERKETIPIEPPHSLKRWAFQENLISSIDYSSEEELREKVYTCLLTIDDKVKEHGINPFWNITYDSGRIISRTPKKETDVQPTISLLLSDQMLQAGIQMVPEFKTGVGDLDFAFIGFVKNQGQRIICAEFKNMHSKDIYSGLEIQLPKYMRNKGAKYGVYCVLSYKGPWFDKPIEAKKGEIDLELVRRKIQSSDPSMKDIRIFMFDMTKSKTASINE